MKPAKVWKKTEKGEEEIATRKYGLSAGLRRVLILVDGVCGEDQVLRKGSILPDDVHSGLHELELQQFISCRTPLLTVSDAKNELIRIARETLGEHSESVIEKIKDAPEDREGLVAWLQKCKKMVKVTIDEKKAEALAEQCVAVLEQLP